MRVSAISLCLVACAPSVPRPAEKPRGPDAAVDLAPAPDGGLEDRSDERPAPGARDALETGGLARPDVGLDAREDPRPDLRPDLTTEPRSDTRSDLVPDFRTDAPTEARGEADAGVRGEAGADTGDEARGDDAGLPDGPPPALPRAGDLFIDELLVNPAGTDTSREWIEIVNATALPLDLRLLHVADAASEVAVDAGIVAAGRILVLGQSLDPTRNGGAPIDLALGNAVSLNNPGDTITLCLGPCADGLILDQVSWTADLGAAFDGHAAIVDPASRAFCPADQPFGTGGSFGSPGATNPPCAP